MLDTRIDSEWKAISQDAQTASGTWDWPFRLVNAGQTHASGHGWQLGRVHGRPNHAV